MKYSISSLLFALFDLFSMNGKEFMGKDLKVEFARGSGGRDRDRGGDRRYGGDRDRNDRGNDRGFRGGRDDRRPRDDNRTKGCFNCQE